jgi:hypothetical protein
VPAKEPRWIRGVPNRPLLATCVDSVSSSQARASTPHGSTSSCPRTPRSVFEHRPVRGLGRWKLEVSACALTETRGQLGEGVIGADLTQHFAKPFDRRTESRQVSLKLLARCLIALLPPATARRHTLQAEDRALPR